jgi:histidinol dehydrogenase
MGRTSVSLRVREKLGHEASEDLADAFEEAKREMLVVAQEKFEARLSGAMADLRVTMAEGFANLRKEMAEMRVEMSEMRSDTIRWSFLFWIGQVAVIIAVLSYMLRPLAR